MKSDSKKRSSKRLKASLNLERLVSPESNNNKTPKVYGELLPVEENNPWVDKSTRNINKIINEIITTERDYLNDLQTIVKVFIEPCQERFGFSSKLINQIFSYLEPIIAVNRELLEDLERNVRLQIVSVYECSCISGIAQSFLKVVAHFQVYSLYCSGRDTSQTTLENLKKTNSSFAKFLETTPSYPECRGLGINDYLIKPLQRICKYPLFLKELLKYIPTGHSDYNVLTEAMSRIEEVVEKLNQETARKENSNKILEILNRLELNSHFKNFQLIQPARVFLKEGDAIVFETFNDMKNEKSKEVYCFLFNDVLLLTKKNKLFHSPSKYLLVALIELKNVKVNDNITNSSFHIFELDLLTKKIFMAFPTSELKKEWMEIFENLIKSKLEDKDSRRKSINFRNDEPLIQFNDELQFEPIMGTDSVSLNDQTTLSPHVEPKSKLNLQVDRNFMQEAKKIVSCSSQEQKKLMPSSIQGQKKGLFYTQTYKQLPIVQLQQLKSHPIIAKTTTTTKGVKPIPKKTEAIGDTNQNQLPQLIPADISKYDQLFKSADKHNQGQISKIEGLEFFASSNLPLELIEQIWTISDRDKDNKLKLQEFRLAMHLIYHSLKGNPLPKFLSQQILLSAEITHN